MHSRPPRAGSQGHVYGPHSDALHERREPPLRYHETFRTLAGRAKYREASACCVRLRSHNGQYVHSGRYERSSPEPTTYLQSFSYLLKGNPRRRPHMNASGKVLVSFASCFCWDAQPRYGSSTTLRAARAALSAPSNEFAVTSAECLVQRGVVNPRRRSLEVGGGGVEVRNVFVNETAQQQLTALGRFQVRRFRGFRRRCCSRRRRFRCCRCRGAS